MDPMTDEQKFQLGSEIAAAVENDSHISNVIIRGALVLGTLALAGWTIYRAESAHRRIDENTGSILAGQRKLDELSEKFDMTTTVYSEKFAEGRKKIEDLRKMIASNPRMPSDKRLDKVVGVLDSYSDIGDLLSKITNPPSEENGDGGSGGSTPPAASSTDQTQKEKGTGDTAVSGNNGEGTKASGTNGGTGGKQQGEHNPPAPPSNLATAAAEEHRNAAAA